MDWVTATSPALYATLLALALFNTVLLLWLGLTVLLTAARRTWGMRFAGALLLAAGGFFLSHTVLVIQAQFGLRPNPLTWWPGWLALIAAPLAWYLAMLWYAGYWEQPASAFRRLHRSGVLVGSLLAIGVLFAFLCSRPVASNRQLLVLYFSSTPVLGGIPLLPLFYPPFVFFCTALALEAIWRPNAEAPAMTALARRRARPWLFTAAGALFGLGALAMLMWAYMVIYGGGSALEMLLDEPQPEAVWLALDISVPLTAAVILLGQALVAYEIFSGTTLPRQGLRRLWHGALLLSAGFAIVASVGVVSRLSALYALLAAAVAVPAAYALFGWRAHMEREQYLRQLRPFLAGEGAYDGMFSADPARAAEAAAGAPFTGLVREVLRARTGALFPLGGLASLAPAPLVYPKDAQFPLDPARVLAQWGSLEAISYPLDPAHCGGAIWAVPLHTARGPAGLLLLGEKVDRGLYSHEEMEIARSAGERLLGTIAGATLAARLMALQRQRLAETQVLDQRSRRALHDEVLPTLHAVMLSLSIATPAPDLERGKGAEVAASSALSDALAQLADAHKRISALIRETPPGSQLAAIGLLAALRQALEREASHEFDAIHWEVGAELEARAAKLPALATEVIFYAAREAIRNAARYGRGGDPSRPLHLHVRAIWQNGLELVITDDGAGSAAPPISTSSGQGLALHSTMMAVIGGSLTAEFGAGGTAVTIALPQDAWSLR